MSTNIDINRDAYKKGYIDGLLKYVNTYRLNFVYLDDKHTVLVKDSVTGAYVFVGHKKYNGVDTDDDIKAELISGWITDIVYDNIDKKFGNMTEHDIQKRNDMLREQFDF